MSKRKILFLCSANGSRSQMAAGWAKHIHPEHFAVHSAGLMERGKIDLLAAKVMAEAGVDISRQQLVLFEELTNKDFDLVVTLCGHAGEHCELFTGHTRRLHFGFDDPAKLAKMENKKEALLFYRRVRDEIRSFIAVLPDFFDLR